MATRSQGKKRKPARKKGWNYPRAGYGPIRRWLPSWRFLLGTLLTFLAVGTGAFAALYVTTSIPEPDDFATAQTTTVYYEDNETRLGSFAEVNRISVPLSEVSPYMQHAVVASEDRTFYQNNGIDLKGIARAFYNNIRGNATQGGSTLTQQYAERYYMGTTTSLPGKVKEAVMAVKINATQSKDTILENYLNTIYFGRGAYGVEAAAEAYFGVSAKDLTLSQAATLTGVIPAPSAWDPAINPDRAAQRFDRTLNLMEQDGWISADERAGAAIPQTLPVNAADSLSGPEGYLITTVQDELAQNANISEDELNRSGYRVITTIDAEKQKYLEDAVASLPEDRPANNYVGAVSMDPRNGEVYAMYGGADYIARQRNLVTQDQAQGGSTFKIFGLLAAVRQGYGPYDRINAPAQYEVANPGGDPIVFNNVDGLSHGRPTLATATAESLNTPFIILNEMVGPANTRQAALDLGLPEDTVGLDNGVGNVLGSASSTPFDMVTAFGTLANEGEKATPHLVREVLDRDGNVIYRAPTTTVRTVERDDAIIVNSMLEGVFSPGGTAEHAALNDRPVAGKTGTSSGPNSAWIGGYTPQMVTVVDMIQIGEDGSEQALTPFGGVHQVAGGNLPADVWAYYMDRATTGMDVLSFTDPTEALTRRGVATREPAPAPRPVAPAPTQEPTPEETTPEPSPTETTPSPEETTPSPEETTTDPATPTDPATTTEPSSEPTESDAAAPAANGATGSNNGNAAGSNSGTARGSNNGKTSGNG